MIYDNYILDPHGARNNTSFMYFYYEMFPEINGATQQQRVASGFSVCFPLSVMHLLTVEM